MNKFRVGDKVRQTQGGSGTDEKDNGKEAIVLEVGLTYNKKGDGIVIKPIEKWSWEQHKRGEKAFELVENSFKEGGMQKAIKEAVAMLRQKP